METQVNERKQKGKFATLRSRWKQWEAVVVLSALTVVPIWVILFVNEPGDRFWIGHIIWTAFAAVLPYRYYKRDEHRIWAGLLAAAGWVMLSLWVVILVARIFWPH